MPYRPLPIKCWFKFLELHGFKFSGRVKGSHHQYTKRGGLRAIPVRPTDKEVPALHLKTGCRTLGISLSDLYNWADSNC